MRSGMVKRIVAPAAPGEVMSLTPVNFATSDITMKTLAPVIIIRDGDVIILQRRLSLYVLTLGPPL